MDAKPITPEEAKKFNEIVMKMSRSEKDACLLKLKTTTGDGQAEYVRSIINAQK